MEHEDGDGAEEDEGRVIKGHRTAHNEAVDDAPSCKPDVILWSWSAAPEMQDCISQFASFPMCHR